MKSRDLGQLQSLNHYPFVVGQHLVFAGLGAIGAIVASAHQAEATLLTNWQFDPSKGQLELTLQANVTPKYFLMAQPTRIVVDLPATKLGSVATRQTFEGPIRQIRLSESKDGQTRVVIELAPETLLTNEQVKLQKVGNRWIVRPLIVGKATATAPSAGIPPETVSPPLAAQPTAPVTRPAPLPPGIPPITPPPQINGTAIGQASLPPAIFMGNQPPTVTVPPLGQSTTPPMPQMTPPVMTAPTPPAATLQIPQPTSTRIPVIEFGQPLPKANSLGQPQTSLPPLEPGGILLPIETPPSVMNN